MSGDVPKGRGRARSSRPAAQVPSPSVLPQGRGRSGTRGSVPPSVPTSVPTVTQQAGKLSISSSNNGRGNGKNNGDENPAGRGSTRTSRTQHMAIDVTMPEWMRDEPGAKKGVGGQNRKIQTNFFSFKTLKKWTLYRHHVDFSPEEDRTKIRIQMVKEHAPKFQQGYLFDGSTIFCPIPLCDENKTLTFTSTRHHDNQPITITVKRAGTCHNTDHQNTQIFNIILRKCMKSLDLKLLGRTYHDPKAKIMIPEYNLELWPGYFTSISQHEYDVLLLAEINFKVLRTDTAYQQFRKIIREKGIQSAKIEFSKMIIGSVVITKHNNKTYRVDDVDYEQNPESTFPRRTRTGSENVKYSDYFFERYGCRILDLAQPLLVSRSNQKAIRAGEKELIYLVPELCVMTGLSEDMRNNRQLMRATAEHTAVIPSARIERLLNYGRRLIEEPEVRGTLTQWGMELVPKLVEVEGRVFDPETIVAGDKKIYSAGVNVDWTKNLRENKVLHPVEIKIWILVYPPQCEADAKKLFTELNNVGKNMGIVFPMPIRCKLRSDAVTDYIQETDRCINANHPALVVFIVPNNRSDRYSAIKKKCILDKPVPSQVITSRSINHKTFTSIATKVAIQINCKVGGAPWALQIPLKGLMIVGYDVCHDPRDKRRSYGAVVATSDDTYTRYFSAIKHHPYGEELSLNFGLSLQLAVQHYHQRNKVFPAKIIVYRDGVGEGSLNYVKEHEVKSILGQLHDVYKGGIAPPKLTFIVVTKRINTRLFDNGRNPQPGTVVDDVITNPFMYDFFLVSQSVHQGTVNPTHYNVIHDDVRLKAGHVQQLTYKLTHMYYNWSGTVRVPAPCQYAHKLAFLTAQSVGVAHSNLNSFLYFL